MFQAVVLPAARTPGLGDQPRSDTRQLREKPLHTCTERYATLWPNMPRLPVQCHMHAHVLPTPSSASPSLPPPDFLSVATCLQVQMNTDPNGDGVGNEYVQFKRRA